MEQQQFKELGKGLITFLEHKNLITLISEKNIIYEELENLFTNCETKVNNK